MVSLVLINFLVRCAQGNHMQLTGGDFTYGSFVDDHFMQAGDWLDTITSSSIVTVRWSPTLYGGLAPLVCSCVIFTSKF